MNELLDKIRVAAQEEIANSIAQEVEEFVKITPKEFTTTMCYNAIYMPPGKESQARVRRAAYQKLFYLTRDGVLESLGWGRFRKVQRDKEIMDWWNADLREIPIKLPMSLSDHHCLYPDNMIGIAGVSNYGKTAFMHRVIKDNIDNKELWDFYEKKYQKEPLFEIFDTDTGPQETRRRIINIMDGNEDLWRACVTIYPRNNNFVDILNPTLITFIDYIRLNTEFYIVGEVLDGLYQKLREHKGICFYGVQKDPDKAVGLGGWFSVHKARLYISIDIGKMTVVKAKNPREGENITNWFCEFDLKYGHTFEVTRNLKPDMIDMRGKRVD